MAITPENLKVSERASLLLPWHRELDALEEARLKDKKYGSTKQRHRAVLFRQVSEEDRASPASCSTPSTSRRTWPICSSGRISPSPSVYGAKGFTHGRADWRGCDDFGAKIRPFVANTTAFLREAQANGKRILFEAQLGALRDHGLRHLSLHHLLQRYRRLCAASARVCPTAKLDRGRGRGQGLLLLRGRRARSPASGSAMRPSKAARGRCGIRRDHRPSAPRRPHRPRGDALRRADAGRDRASPSRSSTCSVLHEGDPCLRAV